MRATPNVLRPIAAAALAAMTLAACSSPSASPGTSPTVSITQSASAPASSSASLSPSPTAPAPASPATGPNSLALELITAGLVDPTGVTNAGDGSNRLFVLQRSGQVRVIGADGTLRSTPFVDLSDRVEAGGERGLLGIAFHPDFAANGRVFVHYSHIGDGATVVSELTASVDRGSANPAPEKILLTVTQPFANHNGGQLAFGPDGYLYLGLGDGGSGGDPFGNGESRQTLLGKILRINVDGAPAPGKAYGIPYTNPFAAGGAAPGGGLPEIWAYGLRNPWRFSFDRGTGDVYIGDVGQNAWEEIDRQPGGSQGGENYGWNAFEGTHCFSSACSGLIAVPPIAEYSHDEGCSVTGGYVYRGTRQPALNGIYLFGDYCSGTIWTVPAGAGASTLKPVADTGTQISSFGEGEDGEIYLVDLGGGGLYRVLVGG